MQENKIQDTEPVIKSEDVNTTSEQSEESSTQSSRREETRKNDCKAAST